MTIDKIKKNLPEYIYNYWVNLIQLYPYDIVKDRLMIAIDQIEKEIESEIFGLPNYYIYELKLLRLLNY